MTYRGAASGALYDGSSPLYGSTDQGGAFDKGTIFEIGKKGGSWKYTVIHDFCAEADCPDGQLPESVPFVDDSGTLLGTASFGGTGGQGTLFRLTPKGAHKWQLKVLHNFCSLDGCGDGELPNEIAMDAQGNLFGTTLEGGANAYGVLYRVSMTGRKPKFSTLYDFCSQSGCYDGEYPQTGVLLDASGNIFGTSLNGGGNTGCWFDDTCGVAYEFSHSSFQAIQAFCSQANCADGAFPYSEPIMDGTGNLFGVAELGGEGSGGTVYELVP